MSRFDRVVVVNKTMHAHNVHLGVHPFSFPSGIKMMTRKGDYDFYLKSGEMAEWQKKLADELWDGIPGLSTLFFDNGQITLQHSGVFTDHDIVAEATDIITPFLEQEMLLKNLFKEEVDAAREKWLLLPGPWQPPEEES
jgi:hypothetical protein